MLDFVYYPISGILWFWHKVFGYVLGADSGFSWALSVIFLTFTARAVLYWPFVKQVRTTRQMQALQPELQAIKKKHGKDRQRMALEMQKLQKEHGFNPLMGCLPMLVQIPVFIGLYHVLRSFNRVGHGFGQLGMSPEQNASTANYWFGVGDVQSFLSARLFGAPISAAVSTPPDQLEAFRAFGGVPRATELFSSPFSLSLSTTVLWVAIPLMIIAGVATHFNMRASIARQTPAMAEQPQTKIMNQLGLWIFPLGMPVFGWFLPLAILLYWVANNTWTYGQQHIVFAQMDREDEAKRLAAVERKQDNAPKPGAKPKRELAAALDATTASDGSESATASAKKAPPRRPAKTATRPGQRRGKSNQRRRGGR